MGGIVAQAAPPASLLADPYDDFVADFVGRDRGYRALSFRAGVLRPSNEPTVQLGERATGTGWLLVVDERNRPVGWVEPERLTAPVGPGDLHRGGTVASVAGSLRAALDAALSSPSRRGVIVDEQGALLGTVRASEVLKVIEDPAEEAAG